MRIVNYEEFLKLPSGTLYSSIARNDRDFLDLTPLDLSVKKQTGGDRWYHSVNLLVEAVKYDCANGEHPLDPLDKAFDDSTFEVHPDFETSMREHCLEEDDDTHKFLIYSAIDIQELIDILIKAKELATNENS